MKKLNKEQCDYVFEQFMKTQANNPQPVNGIPYVSLDMGWVKEILNQCTEKEFPTFTITDRYNKDITASFAPIYKCILLSKIDLEVGEEWILTIEQFKTFTEGCVAITKFLEEENE